MRHIISFIVLVMSVFIFLTMCSTPRNPTNPDGSGGISTCVVCHTDAEKLQALAEPEAETEGEAGEG
ncbi:MAG: hypothetical protein H6696_00815 [Deferribacteres bacterium]|nr:hypothetical protein [candidate division KSB1 bacterium]MCB9500448.1 hypothetical protein [Deferribacteres bacterium]